MSKHQKARSDYGYELSKDGRYELSRDGKTVLVGNEAEVWSHIHQNHSFSVAHALKYEGFSIKPAPALGYIEKCHLIEGSDADFQRETTRLLDIDFDPSED